MTHRFALSIAALLLATAPVVANEETTAESVERLRALAAKDSQVTAHVKHLCQTIGPRLTGSDGINAAYTWTQKQFESYGLKAWREAWGSYPVGFDRGKERATLIAADGTKTSLTIGTNAWTAGTQGPVRGRAILAPLDSAGIARLGARLKGAWVVARRRGRAQPRLWKAGIAGYLYPVGGELIVTSGRAPRNLTMKTLPTRVTVKMLQSQWGALVKRLEAKEALELELDLQRRWKAGPYTHYNVIADLVGSEKPDEMVIVGGHLDSWDGASGATDNATGVATTLEAARLLAKAGIRPKRTIRFILWSGEEQGLLGSRAYVEKHRAEMKKVSGVFVHDGGTNTCSGLIVTPTMKKQLEPALSFLLNETSPAFPFKLREVPGLFGGGSDHSSYLRAGVPGFFWMQRGKAKYTYTHHTQHDHVDQVVAAYQKRSAFVIATTALAVANLDGLLSREKLVAPRRRGRRKTLGVNLDGLTVTSVVPNSRAAKAGVKEGDRFVEGGGKALEDMGDLRRAIMRAQGKTPFVVVRGGKRVVLMAEFPGGKPAATSKTPKRPSLGVQIDEDLVITAVAPKGLAERAGLKAGDKLVKLGRFEITGFDALRQALAAADGPTSAQVLRSNASVVLTVPFPRKTPAKATAKPKRWF